MVRDEIVDGDFEKWVFHVNWPVISSKINRGGGGSNDVDMNMVLGMLVRPILCDSLSLLFLGFIIRLIYHKAIRLSACYFPIKKSWLLFD